MRCHITYNRDQVEDMVGQLYVERADRAEIARTTSQRLDSLIEETEFDIDIEILGMEVAESSQ